MTPLQKTIKYCAIAFAVLLIVSIFGGIFSALGLVGGFFEESNLLEQPKTYTVSSELTELRLEISAAELTVKKASSFSVETNLEDLTVKENGGILTVKQEHRIGSLNGATVTVCIPEDTALDKISVKTGAGRLTADALSAKHLKLELGAGEVTIGTLSALSSAEIEGGAGKITVSDGALSNLDLSVGIGQLELCAALSGESELELGVGETRLTLVGKREDYTVDIEKGLGSITFDGKGLSENGKQGSGASRVSVDGGVGSIQVNFKER